MITVDARWDPVNGKVVISGQAMTDAVALTERIREAVGILNQATADATKSGLRVELRMLESSEFGRPYPWTHVNFDVGFPMVPVLLQANQLRERRNS